MLNIYRTLDRKNNFGTGGFELEAMASTYETDTHSWFDLKVSTIFSENEYFEGKRIVEGFTLFNAVGQKIKVTKENGKKVVEFV